jgi:hypothetical protein
VTLVRRIVKTETQPGRIKRFVFWVVLAPLVVLGVLTFVIVGSITGPGAAFNILFDYSSPLASHAGAAGVLLGIVGYLFVPAIMGAIASAIVDRLRRPASADEKTAIDDLAARTQARRALEAREGTADIAGEPARHVAQAGTWRFCPSLKDLTNSGDRSLSDFSSKLVVAVLESPSVEPKKAQREAEKIWEKTVTELLQTEELAGQSMEQVVPAAAAIITSQLEL